MTITFAPGTDMSLRARKGIVSRGPETLGLYSWLGLYRAQRYFPGPWETRWFLTKRGMLRWFHDALPASSRGARP